MLAVFAGLLALYGFTAPPTVVFEDDGEFVMAALHLGVAHPPGYPLWVLLTHPFTWLPFGSVAWRVHLASGVFGAASCATLWWIARTLVPGRVAAWVAALGFGVSLTFWSQALIADVYTLNVLLFLLSLAVCLAYVRSPGPRPLLALGLLVGLALSNHWPLTLLAAPCLVAALWPARRALRGDLPSAAPGMVLLFALGLTPYVWMVIRSRTAPELAFYSSIDGWSGIRDYVLRSVYTEGGGAATAGPADQLRFALFYAGEAVRQFTPVGALLAAVGAFVGWRRWGPALASGLIAAFLGGTLGLVLLLRVDYEFLNRAVQEVFPLVPYAVMALWMASGLREVAVRASSAISAISATSATSEAASGSSATSATSGTSSTSATSATSATSSTSPTGTSTSSALPVPLATGILGAALVLLVLVANFPQNDRHDYDFADHWGRTVLSTFEPDAVVFTRRDHETFVLGYLHDVEGVRPDVRLMMDWGVGIARDGRLFHPLKLAPDAKERRVVEFVREAEVPVYFFVRPPAPLGHTDLGMYWRVDPDMEEGRALMALDSTLRELFREMVAAPPSPDDWTEYVRDEQIAGMSRVLTGVVHLRPDPVPASIREDLELASSHYVGLLERIALLTSQGAAPPDTLLAWSERAEEMLDETVSKVNRSYLFLVRGRILDRLGRPREALAAFNEAVTIYPDPANPAIRERMNLLNRMRSSGA